MQHLGRADAVDDVDAEMALEPLADVGRQRLAGRRDEPQGDLVALRQDRGGEHAGEAGRRAVEDRGLDAADLSAPAPEHRFRRWPLAHQQHRRANGEREGQRVAEPVGEEQLRRREADVVPAKPQDRLAVELGGPVGVRLGVDGALRPASRPRRIEPEGGIVGVRAGRPRERRVSVQERLELDLAELHGLARTRDHHFVDLMVGLGEGGFQRSASSAPLTIAACARACSSM